MLNIGLIQMRCEKGAIDENLAMMAEYLAEADRREVELIGFPEMCITGYADPHKFPQAVIRLDGREVAAFLALTRKHPALTVLAGLIEENGAEKPFITHIAARDGQLLGSYRKLTIKDDEARWFTPGGPVPVFQQGELTYGISICADIGNALVFSECARQGAQLIFELAAPGLYGEMATRNWQSGFNWWRGECHRLLGGYARQHNLWIAAATQAGRTVDEDFPGGAYLFAPGGECLYDTNDWSPGAVFLELDLEQGTAGRL